MRIAEREMWTRRVGSASKHRLPVVVIPGGPGLSSRYLEPLEMLASDGREVLFYDHLGSGRSADSGTHATLETLVAELAALVSTAGFSRVHLLAHSAGAAVAVHYALDNKEAVASIVAYSPVVDFASWSREQHRLRDAFEPARFESEEQFQKAYYAAYCCRKDPWPQPLLDTMADLYGHPNLFQQAYGTDLFSLTGTFAGVNLTPQLPSLDVPVLLLRGANDYLTPVLFRAVRERLTRAAEHIFAESSHTAHLEEPDEFMRVVGDFLRANDPVST